VHKSSASLTHTLSQLVEQQKESIAHTRLQHVGLLHPGVACSAKQFPGLPHCATADEPHKARAPDIAAHATHVKCFWTKVSHIASVLSRSFGVADPSAESSPYQSTRKARRQHVSLAKKKPQHVPGLVTIHIS